MCGFVGGMLERAVDDARLDASLEAIHHRGPDSRGKWVAPDGRWFLGHTRLSIIGLDNGAQPMSNASGDVQMVVNGEFYGYRGIREELKSQGYVFQTDSDSEIALHLYHRDGMHLGKHLRGEFAAVIADRKNRLMFAIRDRFGIKPLFYTVHEGGIYFASEIKSLLALGVPARWNYEAVQQEAYMFRPQSRSLFDGIYTVPPGHYAVAHRGEVSTYPYWDQEFPTAEELARDDRTDEEVVDGFREALGDAVRERLVADVEVASYLSGGIDSCSVLGLAQQMMDRPIRAYTLCFDDDLFDESQLAREQAEFCGSTFHPVPVTSRDLADAYSDAVWHSETPFINGHGVAKYLLSREVRDSGIKVVFTGEGADEMLGGYPPFRRDVLLYNSEGQDPEIVAKLLGEMQESNKAVPGFVPDEQESLPILDPVKRLLGFVPSWMHVFSLMGHETTAIFRKEFAEQVAGINPILSTLGRLPIRERLEGRDPLNQSLYTWSRIHLPNFILTFLSDRMEMAHSIEGRVPFLDTVVAEFCAGTPIRMKINGMREKHVLREAAKDVIIDPVYNREKHPFSTPPAKEGENDALDELYMDVVQSKLLDEQLIFDPAMVRGMLDSFTGDTPIDSNMRDTFLNRIVSFTLMHERFGISG
ncbi:MAG: asparagine synthase (glutamine-hydrolyzing) [Myxococcota bacterium]|nr:asparagine synthase (glutamine-hydrolyzing) [Myxococcota bacterium]